MDNVLGNVGLPQALHEPYGKIAAANRSTQVAAKASLKIKSA